MDRLVSISEVATALACSTKTVRRKVEKGIIPAIQPEGKGTLLRFDLAAVLHAVAHPQVVPINKLNCAHNSRQSKRLSGQIPNWQKNRNKEYN